MHRAYLHNTGDKVTAGSKSGRTSSASKNKYAAKAYDRVSMVLKKDSKQSKPAVQAAAKAAGLSLNAYIESAIADKMRDAYKLYLPKPAVDQAAKKAGQEPKAYITSIAKKIIGG